MMEDKKNSRTIHIRRMNYEDIPRICELSRYDSEGDQEYRRNGIGMALMDAAEDIAREHGNKVYLDVCLNSDYGPAQRLYIKRGYMPDGKGGYYEEEVCKVNADCKNDDELTLCLIKEI